MRSHRDHSYELLVGLAHAPRQSALFNDLLDLVQVLPFDLNAAREAARIDAQLRGQGAPIGLPDTLIAGVCVAHGIPLLTRNTVHYERVEGLAVIHADQLPR
ncbi:MAG TPA: type II toxin-antitoxin system VapC family toxin [Thermoflexia bacterium]|nr:type II toxin-antitoxin system VapC family toxin [Thermoflexia bacterium]